MTVKKTGNFRASKRGMSTLAVPSRQGLLKINEVKVAQITEWQQYTPTTTGLGNGSIEAYWRRIGDSIDIHCNVTIGSTTDSTNLRFSLPPDMTFNEESAPFDPNSLIWTAGYDNSGTDTRIISVIWNAGTNEFRFQQTYFSGTGSSGGILVDSNVVPGLSSGHTFTARITSFPIAEFSASVTQTIEEVIESSFFDLQQRVAGDGLGGTLEYYNEATVTLAGSGDFTGGAAKVVRINDTVSLQMTTANWQNSSSSQPRTASALLPDWARPNDDLTIVNGYSGSAIIAFFIGSNGTLGYDVRNYSGTLSTNSTLSVARTATWVVEP